MNLTISLEELSALSGLPHLQQLLYLCGLRPYVDYKTALVGFKRGISYQSLSETLYIEPHPGIKGGSPSKDQLRRALKGLERAGLLEIQSLEHKLIFKCLLVNMDYSVQNKAAINPPQKAITNPHKESLVDAGLFQVESRKADTSESPKAAIPLKEDNFIYLLSRFEQFWLLYPEKKSKHKAQVVFEKLNPNAELFKQLIHALQKQINHVETMNVSGAWVPPWKYPANWLAQRCWEDELTEMNQENHRETHRKHHQHESTRDPFWNPSEEDHEPERTNIVHFPRGKSQKQTY